jgi:hypothetical protein
VLFAEQTNILVADKNEDAVQRKWGCCSTKVTMLFGKNEDADQ